MFIFVDKNNCVFERTSYRVPGEKHPRARKVCIGKREADGTFVGNRYYNERCAREIAEEKISELENKVKEFQAKDNKKYIPAERTKEIAKEVVSSRKKAGLTYAIESIADKIGINASLKKQFGDEKANIILSLIQYMIVSKSAAMDDFTFFDADHTHTLGNTISSPTISRLFTSIKEEDITKFFKYLNTEAPKEKKKRPYYSSFDSTAFGSYSEEIGLVAPSKGKQDPELEHFSLAAIYDSKTNMCGYYRLYRGNIPDIKTVKDLSDVANAMGFSFDGNIIFDRGYSSWENVYLIHKQLKCNIMMMLKSNFSVYSKSIEAAGNSFYKDASNFISQQGVFGTTVKQEVTLVVDGIQEKINCFVHVYYSPERYTNECLDIEDAIDFEIERVTNLITSKAVKVSDFKNNTVISDSLRKYIKVVRTSNRSVRLEKNSEAVNDRLKKAGYFAILTTENMNAKQALYIYRGRDNVERLFNVVKNDLGFTRAEVKNDNTLQGKMFIVMLSAMVINFFKGKLRENRQKLTRKMTYNKACLELEAIYSHKLNGKTVYCEISERQKLLLDSLGINYPTDLINVKVKRSYTKKSSKL